MPIDRPTDATSSSRTDVGHAPSSASPRTDAISDRAIEADQYVLVPAGDTYLQIDRTTLYEPLPHSVGMRDLRREWIAYARDFDLQGVAASAAADALPEYFALTSGFNSRVWGHALWSSLKKPVLALSQDEQRDFPARTALDLLSAYLVNRGIADAPIMPDNPPSARPELEAFLAQSAATDYVALFPQWRKGVPVAPVFDGMLQKLVDLYCAEYARESVRRLRPSRIKKLALAILAEMNRLGTSPLSSERTAPSFSTDPTLNRRILSFAAEWSAAHEGADANVALLKQAYFSFFHRIRNRRPVESGDIEEQRRHDKALETADQGLLSGFISRQQRDLETWRSLVLDRDIGLPAFVGQHHENPSSVDAALRALAMEYASDLFTSPRPRSAKEIATLAIGEAYALDPAALDLMVGFLLNRFSEWLGTLSVRLGGKLDYASSVLRSVAADALNPPSSPRVLYERAKSEAGAEVFAAAERLRLVGELAGSQAPEVDLREQAQRLFESPEAVGIRKSYAAHIARSEREMREVAARTIELQERTRAIYKRLEQIPDSKDFGMYRMEAIVEIVAAEVKAMNLPSLEGFLKTLNECGVEISKLRQALEKAESDRLNILPQNDSLSLHDELGWLWNLSDMVVRTIGDVRDTLEVTECVIRSARENAMQRKGRFEVRDDATSEQRDQIGAAATIVRELERLGARLDALRSVTESLAAKRGIAAAQTERAAGYVRAFESAFSDAADLMREAKGLQKELRGVEKAFAKVLDSDEQAPSVANLISTALYDLQRDLPEEQGAAIVESMETLDTEVARSRRMRAGIEEMIRELDGVQFQLTETLAKVESTLPIATAARLPDTNMSMDDAHARYFEFRSAFIPLEHSAQIAQSLNPIRSGSVLSLPLRGESRLLSKYAAADVKQWMNGGRKHDLFVKDIFDNILALSSGEYGLRLAKQDELPEGHPFRSLLSNFDALPLNSFEAALIFGLNEVKAREAFSLAAAIEGANPVTAAPLLNDLYARMALAEISHESDGARLIVQRWALAHRKELMKLSAGRTAQFFSRRKPEPTDAAPSPATEEAHARNAVDVIIEVECPRDPADAMVDGASGVFPSEDETAADAGEDFEQLAPTTALSGVITAR